MELRKNRKAIPCYWESQPVGCLKEHCPFLHQHPRPSLDGSTKSTGMIQKLSNLLSFILINKIQEFYFGVLFPLLKI